VPHVKRLKQCPLQENTYELLDEPSQLITSITNLVELNHTLTVNKYHKIKGEKSHIQNITTANAKTTLKIGDQKISLQKINSSSLALAFAKQKQKYHNHALIWDNLFPVDTVEYHKFPNRRQHPHYQNIYITLDITRYTTQQTKPNPKTCSANNVKILTRSPT
jgi:hypothetical protein